MLPLLQLLFVNTYLLLSPTTVPSVKPGTVFHVKGNFFIPVPHGGSFCFKNFLVAAPQTGDIAAVGQHMRSWIRAHHQNEQRKTLCAGEERSDDVRVIIVNRKPGGGRSILNVQELTTAIESSLTTSNFRVQVQVTVLEELPILSQLATWACSRTIMAGIHGAGLGWYFAMGKQSGILEWAYPTWIRTRKPVYAQRAKHTHANIWRMVPGSAVTVRIPWGHGANGCVCDWFLLQLQKDTNTTNSSSGSGKGITGEQQCEKGHVKCKKLEQGKYDDITIPVAQAVKDIRELVNRTAQ